MLFSVSPSTLWLQQDFLYGLCLEVQSCPTLCDPLDANQTGPSVHEIFQAKILEWVSIFLLQGIFPTMGLNPHLLSLLHCSWILYPYMSRSSRTSFQTSTTKLCQETSKDSEKAAQERTKGSEIHYPQKQKFHCECKNTAKESLQTRALTEINVKVNLGPIQRDCKVTFLKEKE